MFFRFGTAVVCVLVLLGCQRSEPALQSGGGITSPSALSAKPGDLAVPSNGPQLATGTYAIVGRQILAPPKALPNACFIDMNLTMALGGTFEGSLTAHLTMFSRGPCPGVGTADELHGQGTFVGTVQGAKGSLRVEVRARHSADAIAELRVISLTGEEGLSGLHAVLTGTGVQGGGGTYEGQIHFDPQTR